MSADQAWIPAAISAVAAVLSGAAAWTAVLRANRRVKANIRVAFASVSDGTHLVQVKNLGPGDTLQFGAAVDRADGYTVKQTESPLSAGATWYERIADLDVPGNRVVLEVLWTDLEGRKHRRVYWLYKYPHKRGRYAQGNLTSDIWQPRLAQRVVRPLRVWPAWVGLWATYRKRHELLQEMRSRSSVNLPQEHKTPAAPGGR
jgi:hypothetical protein